MLTKDEVYFIKSLASEIETQDTRCTASPYGLIIGKKERQVCDYDNCDKKAIYWEESEFDSFKEFIDDLEEYFGDEYVNSSISKFINGNCEDIDDLRYYENKIADILGASFGVYGYRIVETFNPNYNGLGNFFLTDKSAKEYIEANRHNLGSSAFTYGIHLYRNPEMKMLIDIVIKLGKEL